MTNASTLDRAAELAAHAAEFLENERVYGGSGEAARVTTRHTLQCIAEDMGVPTDEIEAAVDDAIAAASGAAR